MCSSWKDVFNSSLLYMLSMSFSYVISSYSAWFRSNGKVYSWLNERYKYWSQTYISLLQATNCEQRTPSKKIAAKRKTGNFTKIQYSTTQSECRFLSRVEGRGSRVEGRGTKNFFREVYIKILSKNRLRLIRCLLSGKQENSFHETVLY